jgi:hypothetical protein
MVGKCRRRVRSASTNSVLVLSPSVEVYGKVDAWVRCTFVYCIIFVVKKTMKWVLYVRLREADFVYWRGSCYALWRKQASLLCRHGRERIPENSDQWRSIFMIFCRLFLFFPTFLFWKIRSNLEKVYTFWQDLITVNILPFWLSLSFSAFIGLYFHKRQGYYLVSILSLDKQNQQDTYILLYPCIFHIVSYIKHIL